MNTIERKEHLKAAKDYLTKVPAQHSELVLAIKEVISVIESFDDTAYEGVDERTDEEKAFDYATEMLQELGMPAHILGYDYVRYGIALACFDGTMFAVTKKFYPTVASKYNTTGSKVERAIRHAIDTTWDRGNPDILDNYFGYSISPVKGKPTNSEFIAKIVDKIHGKLKMQ